MGSIFIVSTPIGNLKDVSVRSIETLFSSDVVCSEDTRNTGLLLSELARRYPALLPTPAIKPRLIRFDDTNEEKQLPVIIDLVLSGSRISLVSDAGTPLIADPGYRLVREARKRNIPVIPIPGPVAFVSALTVSGIPSNQVLFLGFLPDKSSHRLKILEEIRSTRASGRKINPTVVLYCSPHKLERTMQEILQILQDPEIAIIRELTKIHEQVWTGRVSAAMAVLAELTKGEITLVL